MRRRKRQRETASHVYFVSGSVQKVSTGKTAEQIYEKYLIIFWFRVQNNLSISRIFGVAWKRQSYKQIAHKTIKTRENFFQCHSSVYDSSFTKFTYFQFVVVAVKISFDLVFFLIASRNILNFKFSTSTRNVSEWKKKHENSWLNYKCERSRSRTLFFFL